MLLWGVGVVAATVLIFLSVTKQGSDFRPPVYEPGTALDSGCRVRLVVFDGADWNFVRPIIDSGLMPHAASLLEQGAVGDLGVAIPTISPYMWTSISTGLADDAHGLCDFFTYQPPGAKGLITRFPGGVDTSKRFLIRNFVWPLNSMGIGKAYKASSLQKKVPELWDYLSQAEKSVCVVGWTSSDPASQVNGVMVSDRFGWKNASRFTTFPRSLHTTLESDFSAAAERCAQQIVNVNLEEIKPPNMKRLKYRLGQLQFFLGIDVRYASIGKALVDSLNPDFCAVALRSIDPIEHQYLLEHVIGKNPSPPPLSKYYQKFTSEEEIEIFSQTITRSHALADSLFGTFKQVTDNDVTILISDHGHDQDGSGHRFGPKGIILMAGGPIRSGVKLESPTVFDITPTILHLMGLPVPSGLKGRVLVEAFDEQWLEANPVRLVSAQGDISESFQRDQDLDQLTDEDIEQLKALGYVD
jgi:hypothetical protein